NWRLLVVPSGLRAKFGLIAEQLTEGSEDVADRIEVVRRVTADMLDSGRGNRNSGELFVTVLSAGDELGCDAFLELALATAIHADCDFIYSDERRRNPASDAVDAFFKPQWSPDLILSTNYVGRLWCARADLLRTVVGSGEP